MSIWTSSQPNLKFAWWNTLQQSVDTTVTIFCWKIASAEMLIVVLDNQKQPSEVFWISQISLENLCLQAYNFIRKTPTQVFSCKICNFFFFFFFFWISVLKNTFEQLLLENTYNNIYIFVKHLFVIFLYYILKMK